ncbi:hypothetical protein [Candidatus Finniella inopinata]|uniref:Uncharacterized protein n=1 Tax=Candidatus Finniella inopinata TaxID=1696036 RepID=A0A4Q7DI17_9PROT|nr:hypothetical protein [Candidatus Finniella inopinata]RZI46413.1 hypothetical protein EQU50_02135 [Candidatus Finniella inopinata]
MMTRPSKAIEKYLHSTYSHIGIILKRLEDNQLLCFESTGSTSQVLSGIFPQVQINPLATSLMQQSLSKAVTRDFIFDKQPTSDDVQKFVQKYLGINYEENIVSILKSKSRSNKTGDDSSLFCSELVALMLQQLGYLSTELPADNYTPRDFSEISENVKLIGATLGKEVLIFKPDGRQCFCQIL